MFRLLNKKSVLYLWITVYSILLLIPVVSNFSMLYMVSDNLKKETVNTNRFFLQTVAKTLDVAFSEVQFLNTLLSSDYEIAELAEKTELDPDARYQAGTLTKKIKNILANYQYIYDFYLYYPSLDLIVLNDIYYQSENYYNRRMGMNNAASYQEWKRAFTSCSTTQTYENAFLTEAEIEQSLNIIEFLIPLTVGNNSGRIIVNIRIDKSVMFSDVVNADYTGENLLVVLNSRNKPILGFGEYNDINFDNVHIGNEFDISNITINSKKMNVSYTKSANFRYKYMYITPANQLSQRIHFSIAAGISISALSLLMMLAIIYLLNKWNYGNIKNMVGSLGIDLDDIEGENEYIVIAKKVESVKSQSRELSKNVFLSNLIKGYTVGSEKLYMEYDIKFKHPFFTLMAMSVKDFGVMSRNSIGDTIFVINNIVEDCVIGNMSLTCVKTDGTLFYIINTPSNENVKNDISELFDIVSELSREAVGIIFTAAVSMTTENIDEISELYNEVVNVLEFEEFYGTEGATFYDDIKDGKDFRAEDYSIEEEVALILSLKRGDAEKSVEIVDRWFKRQMATPSKWNLNWLSYNIINIAEKSLNNKDKNDERQMNDFIKTFADCKNITDIKHFFNKLFRIICEINLKQRDKSDEFYYKLKEYIDQNYSDPEINANLQQHFELSTPYLAKLFKNGSGNKMISYINSCRIEKAKQLLIETDIKIENIAKEVGFYSIRTFLLAFKEQEGITPTQYRNVNTGKFL